MISTRQQHGLSAPALRAFENIATKWKLSVAERRALLGNIAKSTYERQRSDPDAAQLSSDTLERISHVLGIYKALHLLFSDDYADRWVKEPNSRFDGRPALDIMLERFTGLVHVRTYLDGQRG